MTEEPAVRIEDLIETAIYELDFAITQEDAAQLVEILKAQQDQYFKTEPIREQLVNWHQQRSFPNKELDFNQLEIVHSGQIAFNLKVEKLTEERHAKAKQVPYKHQNIQPADQLEQVWDQPLKYLDKRNAV